MSPGLVFRVHPLWVVSEGGNFAPVDGAGGTRPGEMGWQGRLSVERGPWHRRSYWRRSLWGRLLELTQPLSRGFGRDSLWATVLGTVSRRSNLTARRRAARRDRRARGVE